MTPMTKTKIRTNTAITGTGSQKAMAESHRTSLRGTPNKVRLQDQKGQTK